MKREPKNVSHIGTLATHICLGALLLMGFGLAAPPDEQGQATGDRPSLDRLVGRVESFWSALAQGNKLRALEYVEPASRDVFTGWMVPSFSDPRVARLEPAREAGEVLVAVEVQRLLPPLASPVTWTVTQKWIFRDGDWFVVVERFLPPFLASPQNIPKPGLSAQEIEERVKRIRRLLSFDTTELDFGTIRQGKLAQMSIGYRLAGSEPLDLVFRNAPQELMVRGVEGRKIQPGNGRIEFEIPTELMAGKVERSFAIVVRHDGVEVPFDFRLRAYVYAPVAALPPVVKFASGEREKEVLIVNNSKKTVRIKAPAEPRSDFSMDPLPLELAPGGSARITVRMRLPIHRQDYRDSLSLDFAEPVEDMASLNLPIIVNPVEEEPLDLKKLTPQQIEELIRKAKKPEFR